MLVVLNFVVFSEESAYDGLCFGRYLGFVCFGMLGYYLTDCRQVFGISIRSSVKEVGVGSTRLLIKRAAF